MEPFNAINFDAGEEESVQFVELNFQDVKMFALQLLNDQFFTVPPFYLQKNCF